MKSVADLWDLIVKDLEEELSATAVGTWFDEVIPVRLEGAELQLYCPNSFKQENVERFHLPALNKCLRERLSGESRVRFLTKEEYERLQEEAEGRKMLRSAFSFENFVVGESNRVAYNAARAVAEGHNEYCNPLVLYGKPGLGKTHLLNAVAAEVRSACPQQRVVCLKGDEFTNDLITAIKTHSGEQFREKYRTASVFLMDDVQFIAGKTQTQEEFYNTFDTLYQAGCSIMITMDRPPRELSRLEERLASRFEGGLMVEIGEPEYDTRLEIVRRKSAERGLDMPENDAAYIAERVTGNVRRLEGVLNRLKVLRELGAAPEELEEIVGGAPFGGAVPETPQDLVRKVAAHYGVEEELIRGRSRSRQVMVARQVAMYVLWRKLSLSTKQIGKLMDRDHSTVCYALQSVEKKMHGSEAFASEVRALEA